MKHSNFGKGMLRNLRSFIRDNRGLSAIEFAFVFPVMATLYLGGTALTQGIVVKRKMTLVTRTIGDLTSQDTCIVDTEMGTIFSAAAAVMEPYSTSTMTLTITSVKVDDKGVATVDWSNKSENGGTTVEAGYTVGDPVSNFPSNITQNSDGTYTTAYFIMAEGSYNYVPTWGQDYVPTIPFSETFYLRPRRVTQITRKTSGCT